MALHRSLLLFLMFASSLSLTTSLPSSSASHVDMLSSVLKDSEHRVEIATEMFKDASYLGIMTVREKRDLLLCAELLESAKSGIVSSINHISSGSISPKAHSEIHTWLSSVLNSFLTCMEDTATDFSRRVIESQVTDLVTMGKQSLAMLLTISPTEDEAEIQMVIDGSYPSWMSDGDKHFLLLDAEVLKAEANLVVAQDGTGNYRTVNEAVAAAPSNSKVRFTIYIKRGVYKEIVTIGRNKSNLTFIGDGKDLTVITGDLNNKDGVKTFDSATLGVNGNNFMARDIGIQNTAGPLKGQAVALRVTGDKAAIYRCRIDGFQDSLYAHDNMQFYRECDIRGTVDFICGRGAAVFQFCRIEARKPKDGQSIVVTAQSRESLDQESGFSIQRCNITASADLEPIKKTVKTFLGRPWGNFSTVAVIESYIDDLVDPSGWTYWKNATEPRQATLIYREFNNTGPGAGTTRRVGWKGFKVITDPKEAQKFTVGGLLEGGSWINATGVPYDLGL